ncbi:AMP-binding protein [Dermacoccus sp. Tok2021]|uniref:AMP-binding protein n=1 Tax=Dermacoccus sp. Tok2021 TaxID=2826873 RepID=UPI001CA6D8BD|nr:AMP-binding protein [Dermacoccus sp. Tok2021]
MEFFDATSAEHRPYTEVADRAIRVAGGLVEAGVPQGSIVPLLCTTGPDLISAFYGIQAAGCVVSVVAPPTAVSGNTHRDHIRAVVSALDADVLVVDSAHTEYVSKVMTEAGRVARLLPLEQLAAAPAARRTPDERALVQFTSGSSGSPRGVVISHAALAANTAAIRAWEKAGPDDAWCSWLPMHHDMGLIGCLVVPVSGNNGLAVCTPETFIRDPRPYLRHFDASSVTRPATITATPAFGLQRIVDKIGPGDLAGADFSHVRAVIVGAERIDPALVRRFTELLAQHGLAPRTLTPAYGLAESTLAVTGVPLAATPTSVRVRRADLRLGAEITPVAEHEHEADLIEVISCGQALEGLEVRVTDEDGRPMAEGHVGELVVSGTSLADGYLGAPFNVGTTLTGGALSTKDAAFEIAGEFFVLGRSGDSVKVNARSLFAEDVELLLARAGLPTSRVCAVLGERNSQACAYVVLEDLDAWAAELAAEVLAKACPGTHHQVLQLPRGSIPRTTSGKSRRRQLWDQLSESHPPTRPVTSTADHPA